MSSGDVKHGYRRSGSADAVSVVAPALVQRPEGALLLVFGEAERGLAGMAEQRAHHRGSDRRGFVSTSAPARRRRSRTRTTRATLRARPPRWRFSESPWPSCCATYRFSTLVLAANPLTNSLMTSSAPPWSASFS